MIEIPFGGHICCTENKDFQIPIDHSGSEGTIDATGGTITLTYSVKNISNGQTLSSGNTISVSIPAAPDNEAPVVTVPGNLVYGGDSSGRTLDSLSVAGISNIAIPVSDNIGVEYDKAFCDSSRFQHLPSNLVFTSEAGSYPIGTTTVNCYADDAAGNRGTASFTVTIIDGDFSIEGVGTPPGPGSDMEIYTVSPYQDGDNWRYTVTGMGPSSSVSFTTKNPDGTNDGYSSCLLYTSPSPRDRG